LLEIKDLREGDIFVAQEALVGVYCFSCHPENTFDILKNEIYTIHHDKVCVYIGESWEGSWDWAVSGKKKMLFVRVIYDGNLYWTNIDWLRKIT
jgi:hypothetical protein